MTSRAAAAVVVLVLVGTVASGVVAPLNAGGPQPGSVERVSVERAPFDEYRLERSRFGAGTYTLRGPPVVVTAEGVTGAPSVRLTVDIPELGAALTNEYRLAPGREQRELRAANAELSPARVSTDRYEATAAVWLRTGDEYRALVQERVTLRVVG